MAIIQSRETLSGLEILMPADGFEIFVWGVSKTDERGAALHKRFVAILG